MKADKELVNKIINSLDEYYDYWEFEEHTLANHVLKIRIWTSNMPILDLMIYEPIQMKFSLFDKFRIYKAIKRCANKKMINLL